MLGVKISTHKEAKFRIPPLQKKLLGETYPQMLAKSQFFKEKSRR
jgi:hypothetical protein